MRGAWRRGPQDVDPGERGDVGVSRGDRLSEGRSLERRVHERGSDDGPDAKTGKGSDHAWLERSSRGVCGGRLTWLGRGRAREPVRRSGLTAE